MKTYVVRKLPPILALMALALLMIGCGGGSGVVATEGGIGGTGITSGVITAFGSIFVNGIEYDLSKAQISTPDNPNASQTDLRIGMVVTVTTDTDNTNGAITVGHVEYRDEVRGTVDPNSIQPNAVTFTALGQSIVADARTRFGGDKAFYDALDPASKLAVLKGMGAVVIQVSGIRNDEGVIRATRVRALQAYSGDSEVKGLVDQLDNNGQGTFKVWGLAINYQNANVQFALVNGMSVVVYGSFDSSTHTLIATRIEQDPSSVGERLKGSGYKVASVQGLVTKLDAAAPKTFFTRGVLVDYSSAQLESEAGAPVLANNALVEVNGAVDIWNGAPRIIATNIEVESADVGNLQRIESGQVIAAPDVATHTIRVADPTKNNAEVLVKVDSTTYFADERKTDPFNYNTIFDAMNPSLRTGDLIEVKGYLSQDGSTLVATTVERLKM